jgi:tetratricopeptide (TPR) repeat protein
MVVLVLGQGVTHAHAAQNGTLQALHDEGRAAFREGRYEDAAEAFERAYARDPHPVLLWNTGRAYEEAKRWVPAREAFTRYRALENLSVSQRLEAALKLLDIERHLVAEGARRREAGRTTGRLVAAALLHVEPEPPGAAGARATEGLELTTVDTPEPHPSTALAAAPWLVGVGAALALAGSVSLGVAGVAARDLGDVGAYEGLTRSQARDRYARAAEEVRTLEVAGWVVLGAGVAASAAGVLAWWIGAAAPSEGTPAVSVVPTRGGAMVQMGAGF